MCLYRNGIFGGIGTQIAEAWENGKSIHGPLISYDGVEPQHTIEAKVVENAINQILRILDIYKHEGKDEFDSIGLGNYRSNERIIDTYLENNTP